MECSICDHHQRSGNHCQHLAALAIKVMSDTQGTPFPTPLLFKLSQIAKLGKFLSPIATNPRISAGNNNEIILQTSDFSIQLQLDNIYDLLPVIFSHNRFPNELNNPRLNEQMVQDAWAHLRFLCRSPNERTLNDAGQSSNGQVSDSSLWTQICHLIFQASPVSQWQLQRLADNKGFCLYSNQTDKPCLQITPSRQQLINLLTQTDNLGLINIKNTVRAYSKIYFEPDDNLIIEPWLDLGKQGKHQRREIEDCIYTGYCSIKDNIFHEIAEQKDNFAPEAKQSSLPLLAFADKQNSTATITIPAPEVPAFLDKHLRNILSGRHDPDPALENFSINDLPDTIEVLDYNEDDDWCYLSARYTCGSRHLDLWEIIAMRDKGQDHATSKEKWLNLRNTPLDWFYKLGNNRLQNKGEDTVLRLTKLEMMALTSLVPELTIPPKCQRREQIKASLANLRRAELAADDIPAHLRDYQRTGLAWLNHLCINGIGGILADDMGLGKTHQALALLQLTIRAGGGPALVVCPASVLPHWQDKIEKFYPDIEYKLYYGSQRRLETPKATQVLLTTYGVMRQDIDLTKIHFGVIIYDEIQYLKNRDNATSKAANRLNCRVCFGMSGTPVENSLTDLKAILDICLPELLGSTNDFRKTYVIPIEEHHDKQRLATLQRLTQPFMLRRNRHMVLHELPEIIEDNRFCHLSSDQQALYKQAIDAQKDDLLAAAHDAKIPFPQLSFIALVQKLKQICNHPAQLAGNCNYDDYQSGKWELFKEILAESLQEGMKVVVFSQFTGMLDIIEQYLSDMNISYTGLRGSTSMNQRRRQVESFNKDKDIKVFCSSLLAGGTGIDLTGAQAVIHYDRWWNAAREEQATARVHRLGQHRAVQVFKFITTGTLEEKIHRLIARKQDLAAKAVQYDDGSIIKRLSRDEIADILQYP